MGIDSHLGGQLVMLWPILSLDGSFWREFYIISYPDYEWLIALWLDFIKSTIIWYIQVKELGPFVLKQRP